MWIITLITRNISNTLYKYGHHKVDPQKKEDHQAIMVCAIIEEEKKNWRVEENDNVIMCNYWGRKFWKRKTGGREKKKGKRQKVHFRRSQFGLCFGLLYVPSSNTSFSSSTFQSLLSLFLSLSLHTLTNPNFLN